MVSRLAEPALSAVALDGYAFIPGDEMRQLLLDAGSLADRDAFARSWDNLAVDTYMADGGRYRKRRHAVYTATADGRITRAPHQPHYQSLDYNPLNGGIARWFEPIDPAIGDGATLGAILRWSRQFFEGLTLGRDWHVEVHQFRIEARAEERGQPTPEGLHRDGVDYVLVLLVDRVNIVSGTTTVHSVSGRPLGSFTLATPFDATVLDDARVAHGVTPIAPLDASQPGHRDALVVTWLERAKRSPLQS
jgi:hypothetical protein